MKNEDIAVATTSTDSKSIEKLFGQPTPLLQDDNEPKQSAPRMNN